MTMEPTEGERRAQAFLELAEIERSIAGAEAMVRAARETLAERGEYLQAQKKRKAELLKVVKITRPRKVKATKSTEKKPRKERADKGYQRGPRKKTEPTVQADEPAETAPISPEDQARIDSAMAHVDAHPTGEAP